MKKLKWVGEVLDTVDLRDLVGTRLTGLNGSASIFETCNTAKRLLCFEQLSALTWNALLFVWHVKSLPRKLWLSPTSHRSIKIDQVQG